MAVAAALEKSERATVESLVAEVWASVRSGKYSSVAEAAHDLLPRRDLPIAEMRRLAICGLISLAHDAQHTARSNGSRPIGLGRPSGRALASYMTILATPYEDASGKQRPLLDFKSSDLDSLAARCTTVGAGWMRRARIVENLRKLLERHSVSVVRDLPPEVLEQAALEFHAAFGRNR